MPNSNKTGPDQFVYAVSVEEIKPVEKELIKLYNREIFEKQVYLEQSRKFEGVIIETLKILIEQEEKHTLFLRILLSKINVNVPGHYTENIFSNLNEPISKIIKQDIEYEKLAILEYNNAIKKASPNLKLILEHIMHEELFHIKKLQDYLAEHSL